MTTVNTAANRTEAADVLKTYGRVIYCGCEIWETRGQSDLKHSYSGRYRVSPAGCREEWRLHISGESAPLNVVLAVAERIGA